MMIRVFTFLLILFLSFPASAEDRKTIIHDQAEAELLLGKHSFSNAFLSSYCSSPDCFGDAIIYEEDGVYHINGGHYKFSQSKSKPYWSGGYIILKGIISEIHPQRFVFEGTIYTNSFWNGRWNPCLRGGVYQFTRDHIEEYQVDHKGKFWRLYAQELPDDCGMDADIFHIDVLVEKLPH